MPPLRYGSDLLTGDHIRLTPLTEDDVKALNPQMDTVAYMRLAGTRPAFPRNPAQIWQDIQKWRKQGKALFFGIRTLDDDRLVGNCGLGGIVATMRHAWLALGIAAPADRGKGFGGDALRVLLRYGFMELNLHRIELQVNSYNTAAIALYRKNGFTHEATLREALYKDLQYHDVWVMSLLADDWHGH